MNTLINRREALRKTTLLMGAAISTSTLATFLQSCKSSPELNFKPVFFSIDQAQLLSSVTNIIIPKTDTPGALEVGVPKFIDTQVKECYTPENQKKFLEELTQFDEGAKKEYNHSFNNCTAEQQLAYVKKTHDDAVNAEKSNHAPYPFILKLKELAMVGYFASEPGATKVLQYIAVPGSYKGCIPLSQAGNSKTWAT